MKVSLAVRIATALVALSTAGFVGAQVPGGGPGFGDHKPPMERALGPHGDHGHWWNKPEIVEKLKLTENQRKAMDDILLQHREKLVDLRANVDKAELEMEPMMRSDQPNENEILGQIDKLAQARAELEKANARFLFALRGKLTPEQWKQVQEFRANHEGMHRDGMRRDFGPRRPRRSGGSGDQQMTPPPPGGPQGMLDSGPETDGPQHAPAVGAIQ